MSPDLPPSLRYALDRLTENRSRNDLIRRATALSEAYRRGGGSEIIASEDDALAYALARLPATYAAAAAVLAAVQEAAPGFAPTTLVDVGAGPGTASFAAALAFPTLEAIDLLERNPHFHRLCRRLTAEVANPALQAARCDRVDLDSLAGRDAADLVIASYVAGEIPPQRLSSFAELLWSRTRQLLLVVEPGTPAGYERIAHVRAHLLARGAHVIAPCPHDHPCPIAAPDWCHFARRLARSRDHRLMKAGAAPFEDEKFSYVALAHGEPQQRYDARVLAPPRVSKVEARLKLCLSGGAIAVRTVPRRARDAYKACKNAAWGDVFAVEREDQQPRGDG